MVRCSFRGLCCLFFVISELYFGITIGLARLARLEILQVMGDTPTFDQETVCELSDSELTIYHGRTLQTTRGILAIVHIAISVKRALSVKMDVCQERPLSDPDVVHTTGCRRSRPVSIATRRPNEGCICCKSDPTCRKRNPHSRSRMNLYRAGV